LAPEIAAGALVVAIGTVAVNRTLNAQQANQQDKITMAAVSSQNAAILHNQNTSEQGRDAQGKFASKQPGQTAPGADAEKKGLASVGAVKNNTTINGTKRDGTISATGQHVEVKSGKTVSDTGQLKSMGKTAVKTTGQPLVVVVTNPNATVSKNAQANENLKIVRPPNQ
jgi:hypothetical protein